MYALRERIQRNNQRMVIAFIACPTLAYGLVG
jgi:hypothetical protein